MSDSLSLPQGSKPANPYKSPEVAAKLLGNSNKQRLTDSTPETETVIISTIAFAGAAHRWTWALFRPTRIGAEMYAEIPQTAHPDYAVDQAQLQAIFALYPEIKYITSHPQMLSLWPSIECTFKRVPKATGKGTRLQLISFKQREHYRECEIEREEQLQKLMGATKMSGLTDNNMDEQLDVVDKEEAEQWAELGKPDNASISGTPTPLLGRVHSEKDYYLVSGHIAKHLKLTDKADIGRATREAMDGKTWPEMWPKEDDDHAVTPEQWQAAADNVARLADEYVTRKLNAPAFEVTLATARNTAMVTFGNYSVDANKSNFKAATGYDNALQYMSQPGATVDGLKKAIADWCLVHNAELQNATIKNAPKTNETAPTGATTPEPLPTLNSEPANAGYQAPAQKLPPVQSTPKGQQVELHPSSLLTELKTLTGIPVTQIRRYASRKYDPRYIKEIEGKKKDEKWTELNPIGARKRLDKLFGFHGLGWRIVPAQGGGQVTCIPYTEHVEAKPASGKYPARAAYERSMYAVTMSGYVLEYALVDGAGNIRYVQTSAFSDGDKNDDMGYAHRGAFTSLMKQALKMLGGMDRFMDKAWEGDEDNAA